MDAKTYEAVRGGMIAAHTAVMEHGMVGPPALHAARSGRLIGYTTLRPVHVGQDAVDGIEQLAMLAAGAEADEVMMSWESQDLAAATGAPADYDGPCLSILLASTAGHRLERLPYREYAIGVAENGLNACAPDWLVEPAPEVDGPLPEAVGYALALAFAGWGESENPGLDVVTGYLEEHGFSVRLLVYREDAAGGG